MEKLLVVDDNEEIRTQLKWGLGKDYQVLQAGSRKEALTLLEQHRPRVVTLDLGLPPDTAGWSEGLACLEEIRQRALETKVIVITGRGEREVALQAVQGGAYDFYQKPIDLAELKVILQRAFQLSVLEEENRRLKSDQERQAKEMAGLYGQCRQMQEIFATIKKVAKTDAPVLILGESGTGKELVAAALHEESRRKDGPFIPINCGAIPETLLESELFGHEKGSFTGAQARVQGKFEYAHRGTLFLDEIGELPVALQVKLLRFLQGKVIQRVGGRDDIVVDARIVAATNVDIAAAIANGAFREDLYYRIGVIVLHLPALRERGSDISLLANLFLQRASAALKKRVKGFSAAALAALEEYQWPGNVRELENRVQRAAILAEAPILEPHHLGFGSPVRPPRSIELGGLTLREERDRLEREIVIAVMEREAGNIVRAAETLGVSRPAVYALMKKHGLHFSGGNG
ncbi:MAG: PEP-CTERM-box response regulator transcription factor [Desulfuromonadales bacterium]|nr:PEP-CTERM-box response regulator transcription factor [Desulfuromonadales bacterium]